MRRRSLDGRVYDVLFAMLACETSLLGLVSLYTHSVVCSLSLRSLGCTKTFLRVTHGFIAQGTLYFFMILATVSETFSTQGITTEGLVTAKNRKKKT